MGQCECRNQDTEREEIETADNNNDLDYYNFEDYNYEIELSNFHKILIVILNILTGGIGTMLVPFLNKKRKIKVMIIAGILIGIFQILHFLHFFSLISGIKFLEDFYESISEDKFLSLFFEVSSDNDKLFPDENEENEENEEKSSILGFIIDTLKLNLSETLAKKQRKKVLKAIFGSISGMSYSNSLFTILVNLVNAKPDAPNYKLSIKIFLYNLFNPGVGFILSCFSLFPACDCEKQKYNLRGIILSISGMIFGVLLMICPFSLGIGIYLVKLTDKMFTIFPIKITFIFIGGTGVIISFILSGINKKTILEAAKIKVNPLDIFMGCGDNAEHLISEFGWSSFFKIIFNMVIPGSGTLCLLCKYGCDCYIILVSLVQLFGGIFFFFL
jgi:hypothetical protein